MMKNKYQMFYSSKQINTNIIITLCFAFSLQLIAIFTSIGDANLGLLDYYINSATEKNIADNLYGWCLPLFVSLLVGVHFTRYSNCKELIFTRTKQSVFIYRFALVNFAIAFAFTFLFFLASLFFLAIIMFIVDPNIYIGVSLNYSLINGAFYFSNPYLTIFIYAISTSLCAGIFSLIGFITSLCTKNKVLIIVFPLVMMVLYLLVTEGLSFGNLFNYNNMIALTYSETNIISKSIVVKSMAISIIFIIATLSGVIYKKGKSDL